MNRSGWRSHLTALLTALVACVGLLSLSTAPAWAAAGTVTEFNVPSGTPFGISAGPDGNLWFTDDAGTTAKIGRVSTGGSITEFPLSTASSVSQFITAGPDGNLWFTEELAGEIGRITTS